MPIAVFGVIRSVFFLVKNINIIEEHQNNPQGSSCVRYLEVLHGSKFMLQRCCYCMYEIQRFLLSLIGYDERTPYRREYDGSFRNWKFCIHKIRSKAANPRINFTKVNKTEVNYPRCVHEPQIICIKVHALTQFKKARWWSFWNYVSKT